MSHFVEFAGLAKKQLFPGIHANIVHSDKATYFYVTLDQGAILPEHHHVNEQWSTVIEGELEMEVNGKKMILTPGSTLCLGSNEPHAAIARTRCVVIDVFIPRRTDV